MSDILVTILLSAAGVICALAAFIFVTHQRSTKRCIEKLFDKAEANERDLHRVEKMFLEYQLQAHTSFVLKEDCREKHENSLG